MAVAVAVTIGGCAADRPVAAPACADLTGVYENQSSPSGQALAPFFLGADDRAATVSIVSQGASGILVSTPNRRNTLAIERDFSCAEDGIRLVKTDTRNIRLPPLIVETEIFHYVFSKAQDGSLRMIPHVETKGTSFGLPIRTREEQQQAEVRWRAVRSSQD